MPILSAPIVYVVSEGNKKGLIGITNFRGFTTFILLLNILK